MERLRDWLFIGALLVAPAAAFTGCGRGRNARASSADTSPMYSAPDNNSANDPSRSRR